ncbi:hypothetical protein HYPSUDRAFT_198430 [Hypholoma sublateritium FD-334 SS-4]|uniref:GATA-type domain-containing protein n=1 Tax=Hypholoma sublateritium (strain FD-334 SS-4) TaxID=945553 RepID=A0A0D2P835_HYPSF|nr:hypothetical protein HYPSUDRAFT_198430 [Hypholoma sublateritium FD-334 SS-4]
MSTATQHPGPSQPQGVRSPPAFEFPKRKRWADLLLTELVDDVAFVLSPSYKIMYCGTAVTELLGWKDIGLSDWDFLDLVSLDQERFRNAFENSLQNGVEFDIAVGLRTSAPATQYSTAPSQQEMLFDMKFYPHIAERDAESRCIFAMALPYAGRNTAMLNTILDLRADNDRLQLLVTEHRARLPAETSAASTSSPSQAGSMYATSSLNTTRLPLPPPLPHKSNDVAGLTTDPSNMTKSSGTADGLEYGKASLYTSNPPNLEEHGEEGSKKKKLKRAQNAEQYVCVTCGRTDSPEWRKGPLGPKTLCNACGLRWAKQMRKVDEPTDDASALVTGS